MGEKIRWPKNQVWCTGGKHPKPCIPKFDENGVIISSIGCSHLNTAKDCDCECHKKPRPSEVEKQEEFHALTAHRYDKRREIR
jgi:hypothetical protein